VDFTVRDISTLGTFDAPNRRIFWGPFWDGITRTLIYTLVPPTGFNGTAPLDGAAFFFGATATTTGDVTVTVTEPGRRCYWRRRRW